MKEGIHPKYHEIEARCACGATWKTRSTKPELHLEICNNCHPFFTGRQKLIDTEGRVERFTKRFGAQTSESRKAGREGRQGQEDRRRASNRRSTPSDADVSPGTARRRRLLRDLPLEPSPAGAACSSRCARAGGVARSPPARTAPAPARP